jgi:hypothetical protein
MNVRLNVNDPEGVAYPTETFFQRAALLTYNPAIVYHNAGQVFNPSIRQSADSGLHLSMNTQSITSENRNLEIYL